MKEIQLPKKSHLSIASSLDSSVYTTETHFGDAVQNEACNIRWTKEEEDKLVKKLDWRIIPFVSLLQLLSFLDRVNIGNAKIANKEANGSMEEELGLNATQYSIALSVFFIGYVLFEVPSNIMLKKVTPSRWIARIMVSWGILSSLMAATQDFNGIIICRVLLGMAEAGFFPGIVYYFSFWYKKEEQAFRVAIFLCSGVLAGAFGGFLAYLISGMHNVGGLSGWRWIFIIEGVPSVIFGVICWFYLPDFPYSAGFLNENERKIATQRLQSNGSSQVNDSSFNMRECIQTMLNFRTWLFSLIYLGLMIPIYSFSFFLPTLISNMGVTSLKAQLLSAPPYLITYFATIAWAYHSDKTKNRTFHIFIPFIFLSLGYLLLSRLYASIEIRYALTVMTLSTCFMVSPPFLAWHTSTIYNYSNTVKATSTAVVVSIGNLGGAVAPFLYSSSSLHQDIDTTTERTGNFINSCIGFSAAMLVWILKFYLDRNAKKGVSNRKICLSDKFTA